MSNPELRERIFTVSAAEVGERLDRFLCARCPDLTRNQIQQALSAGQVAVDARGRPKSHRLALGSEVRFRPLPPAMTLAEPQEIPLPIVHQDEDIVVVNKPPGLVVHPAPGHPDQTLVNALLHHCRQLQTVGDPRRPGIVHRLDRDTSGLMVVALNERAQRSLAAQLRRRTLHRIYLALCWGCWREPEGVLEGAIGRHPQQRKKMAVLASGGRCARTLYRVEEDFDFVQLCRIQLTTGRTHQIRVHFAAAGHPVVGDPLYGDDRRSMNVRPVEREQARAMVKMADRQLLHAAELTLSHPRDGAAMTLRAELPADMAAIIQMLRQRRTRAGNPRTEH